MSEQEKDKVKGELFDYKRVANFSDDALGVLGWKGIGLLLGIFLLGFGLFKVLF